jgi:hypothetical protein
MVLLDTWVDGGHAVSMANPVGVLALHMSNSPRDPTLMQSAADG